MDETALLVSDFDYHLPEELIAQHPAVQRDASRLMVVDPARQDITSTTFSAISTYFASGDVLVINDTRVIPARLFGRKLSGGKVEVLLVRRLEGDEELWLCLTRSSKGLRVGTRLLLADTLAAEVVEVGSDGYRHIRFDCDGDFFTLLDEIGTLPLPPYITRAPEAADMERYQTTFASNPGAVAAPTAGLHFTAETFAALERQGVEICRVTLHVGLGTFLPLRVEKVCEHKMHAEYYHIPASSAAAINRARSEGRRVVALGTTAARTIEYAAAAGTVQPGSGLADIFIYPGYRFRAVDALVTNFHLPQSTLLMLVSAAAGREFILSAYKQAVAERYRFFSYGDCMFITSVVAGART